VGKKARRLQPRSRLLKPAGYSLLSGWDILIKSDAATRQIPDRQRHVSREKSRHFQTKRMTFFFELPAAAGFATGASTLLCYPLISLVCKVLSPVLIPH